MQKTRSLYRVFEAPDGELVDVGLDSEGDPFEFDPTSETAYPDDFINRGGESKRNTLTRIVGKKIKKVKENEKAFSVDRVGPVSVRSAD